MIPRPCRFAIALTYVFGVADLAQAQLNGVPAWQVGLPNPYIPNTILIAAHTTTGEDFVGETDADWGFTAAYRRLLLQRLTVTGGIGATKRDIGRNDRTWKPQCAISAAVNLLHYINNVGNLEAGFSPMIGYGLSELPGEANEQNLLVGLDVSVIRGMGGWFLEVAVIPRWSWRRTDLEVATTWQNGFGLSGGVTVGFPAGLALHFAVDKVYLGASTDNRLEFPETRPLAGSLGIRWNW